MKESFQSWLELHGLESGLVQDCLRAIEAGHLRPSLRDSIYSGALARGDLNRTECTQSLVKPAILRFLGNPGLASLIDDIQWTRVEPETSIRAHTIDHGLGAPPEVCIGWRGDAKDLISLAHEVAHAVQIQLSSGSPMPPVARETCAFLGELALIDDAQESNPALGAELLNVWNEENGVYLGRDRSKLRLALESSDTSYHYDLNYPLARAAAILLFMRH